MRANFTFQWWPLKCGHWSMTAVQMASIPPNCEPMPSMNIIKKKSIAHKRGIGINSTASGYAMNARPGPDCTTSPTGTFRLCAIKPITENTAKPAKIAVNTFVADTINASIWQLLRNCIHCARPSGSIRCLFGDCHANGVAWQLRKNACRDE